jgi:serine protease AprX
VTGRGVDVALVDSGVTPVLGAPNVVNGPDLTPESQNAKTAALDTYGHGTHMAGIIAGHDPAVRDVSRATSDSRDFLGVAPNARIVSVKVADAHGATDVSQVIAGIAWVIQHAHDRAMGLNIRVLNLSFGTDSAQSYKVDPLAYAAEQAWKHGIVVVTSAGNAGASSARMTDPAIDPYVIAVGADDSKSTKQPGDDTVPSFSSRGDGTRNPDVVAPGVHVQSLRVPGSYIDVTYGSTGRLGTRFFRGSGTSQATAVVSGVAALLVQQRPTLTPDQVKALLAGTALTLPAANRQAQGHGIVSAKGAADAHVGWVRQLWPASTGTGSLEASRGTRHLVLGGVTLKGERDFLGGRFDAAAMATAEAGATSWSGGVWNGQTWAGSTWAGKSWADATWTGVAWDGKSWADRSWSSGTWDGKSWADQNWTGKSWAGATWSATSWDGKAWADNSWR